MPGQKDDGHELDSPPWRRVDATLMACARTIRLAYDTGLEELRLSLAEASLLAFVMDAGPINQSEIASKLNQGRAATGSRIDTLEQRNLARRLPDPSDRRVWLVEVTEEGRAVVDRINQIDLTIRTKLRTEINHDERVQLAAILVKIQDNATDLLEHLREDQVTSSRDSR